MHSASVAVASAHSVDSGRHDTSYVAPALQNDDAVGYRSAGILLYDFERPAHHSAASRGSLRLLMGKNHENKVEFLAGKREIVDADVYATAVREFDEESGGILADSATSEAHRSLLEHACRSSRVLWCCHRLINLHVQLINLHVQLFPHADAASGFLRANLRCFLFQYPSCSHCVQSAGTTTRCPSDIGSS
jgi:hypothetical protein